MSTPQELKHYRVTAVISRTYLVIAEDEQDATEVLSQDADIPHGWDHDETHVEEELTDPTEIERLKELCHGEVLHTNEPRT